MPDLSTVSNNLDCQYITPRAKRERETYNDGLKRKTYDNILSHCDAYWRTDILNQFRKTLNAPTVTDALELGSYGWAMVFEDGIPAPSSHHCLNISEAELEIGRSKAAAQDRGFHFHLMDAHDLKFDDNSFDVVYGFGILHHLDYARALDEIQRVLRPSGIMIFNEPLDMNPVGKFIRTVTPNARTADEQPIRREHIDLFRERFEISVYPQQFLSVPIGIVSRAIMKSPQNFMMRAAYKADKWLSTLPGIKYWFRKAVIIGVKTDKDHLV